MRYYPLHKDPRVYLEELEPWKKRWTCFDEWKQYYRKIRYTNAWLGPTIYYPEINADELLEERLRKYCEKRCSPLKKKRVSKKKKNDRWIRFKYYPTPEPMVYNVYKEINLERDFPVVKTKDLYIKPWDSKRRKPDRFVRLPTYYKGTRYNHISTGPPNKFTDRIPTMSYAEIKELKIKEAARLEEERLAAKAAKKAAKKANKANNKGKAK